VCFLISICVLIKDITQIAVFIIRKYMEHRMDASFRPQDYPLTSIPKLDKESMLSMKAYLLDP
jgi:hypothetical protein